MPFLHVSTNLSRNQLPLDFMPKFAAFLAELIGKAEDKMKWMLDTDKVMGRGCDLDSDCKPFLLVELRAFGTFGPKDNCHKFVPAIFEYLSQETALKEEDIFTLFGEHEQHQIGARSKALGT